MQAELDLLYKALRPRLRDFPRRFVAVDTETTGLSVDDDLILQLGYCLVENGKVVERSSLILDWTSRPDLVDEDVLQERLTSRAERMQDGRYTPAMLAEEGVDPVCGLLAYQSFVGHLLSEGYGLSMHFGLRFDWPLLASMFEDFLGHVPDWTEFPLWDTAAIEKAMVRAEGDPKAWLMPEPGDSATAFMRKVLYRGGRHKFNLGLCAEKYGLDIGSESLHDASTDAWLTALTLEKQRERIFSGSPLRDRDRPVADRHSHLRAASGRR